MYAVGKIMLQFWDLILLRNIKFIILLNYNLIFFLNSNPGEKRIYTLNEKCDFCICSMYVWH